MYRNTSLQIVMEQLPFYLEVFVTWLRKSRIKVNATKRAATIFSNKSISPDVNLSLNGDDIPSATSYKYLGIYLDSKLTKARQIT